MMELDQLENFWYWINERHRIYCRRKEGKKWPWTDDTILQEYKFTNPFRQYDAVTVELCKRLDMDETMPRAGVLLAQIIVFRMFNWPNTYDALINSEAFIVTPDTVVWNEERAKACLHTRAGQRRKVFTGAYIITNQGSKRPKIDLVCEAVTHGLRNGGQYLKEFNNSVERTVEVLRDIPLAGPFVAYEMACDILHHTTILAGAVDRYTWANPGPGAFRGLNRIHGRELNKRVPVKQAVQEMRDLLAMGMDELKTDYGFEYIEKAHLFDMRAVEHSLCEFDKYSRVLNGEGRPRSRFTPPHERKGNAKR